MRRDLKNWPLLFSSMSTAACMHVCVAHDCMYSYRIAGNFRGAHISRISRMGSNSRTLKSPKLISSLKVGVVYLLARSEGENVIATLFEEGLRLSASQSCSTFLKIEAILEKKRVELRP